MTIKKSKKANLENKRVIFLEVGLILALSFSLLAFEWKSMSKDKTVMFDQREALIEEDFIDITVHERKEVVKPQPVIRPITIVDDIEDIDVEDIEFDAESDDDDFNSLDNFIEEEPDIATEETPYFRVVESMPVFPGGLRAMQKFLGNNITYPQQAREAGIDGTVFVEFTVSDNGRIKDINLLRTIGGGCDEEALRVVNSMPDWIPGKQRGKAVNVRMSIPIKFVLN